MSPCPLPTRKSFRDDVVAVTRGREPRTTLKQIVDDFGSSGATLTSWLNAADVESGKMRGVT